jgi:tetratricopeptide (TPR) repeat protein
LSLVVEADERADMLYSLANIYFDTKDYQNSLKLFKEIISLIQESSFTYLRFGDVYRRLEYTKGSIDACDIAIAYDYVSPLAYLYRGEMKFIIDVEDWPESKIDLQKYIELVPEDPEGYCSY